MVVFCPDVEEFAGEGEFRLVHCKLLTEPVAKRDESGGETVAALGEAGDPRAQVAYLAGEFGFAMQQRPLGLFEPILLLFQPRAKIAHVTGAVMERGEGVDRS